MLFYSRKEKKGNTILNFLFISLNFYRFEKLVANRL